MDNVADKDPPAAPKPPRRVRVNRSVSVYSPGENGTIVEERPLTTRDYGGSVSFRRRDLRLSIDEEMPQNSFEYMFAGPSPPAESTPDMHYAFEKSNTELNFQMCQESIKQSLLEQAHQVFVPQNILDDIEANTYSMETAFDTFKNVSKVEKNLIFLWAVFHKRSDLLETLLLVGSDLHFHDSGGMTALHLSAYVGCLTCANYLISKGADVNRILKCFSPLHCASFGNNPEIVTLLIKSGANISLMTKREDCEETVLHCAVRSNAVECLEIFVANEELNINSIEPSGLNCIHLAAELGMEHCLEVLLKSGKANVNAITKIHNKESTALHLAADEANIECLKLLLENGGDASIKNHKGFTPLHLAARASSLECVDALLKNGNSDPNACDLNKRTPLHFAIRKSERAPLIIEKLIQAGANVNQKDDYEYTALHLASVDGFLRCVETLIRLGANVTTKSKKGITALNVMLRKTPTSISTITTKLDEAITLQNTNESSEHEIELLFDFNYVLQRNCSREISFLNTFVDEGKKEFLGHPLCSAFLHIKWEKIRKFYIARLLFYLLFILILSLYILTALAQKCYFRSEKEVEDRELCQKQSILGDLLRKNPFVVVMQWWVLAGITVFEIFRKVFGMAGYSTVRQYLVQIENLMDWFVIFSIFIISYVYTRITDTWQNHIGAFAVLAGWTNIMLMVGQFPILGSYVAMYQKVQKEFAKLFVAYICILIGFTFSFCVIFYDSPNFANPFVAFIKTVAMMIGELDLDLLSNDPDGVDPPVASEITAQITFILFQTFVTIMLMNLLVGIAVPDIRKLRKTAGLAKLVRQTKLISYMELALINKFLPNFLSVILRDSALVSLHQHIVILNVNPFNPEEKRLPKDIMIAAYDIATKKKNGSHFIVNKAASKKEDTDKTDLESLKFIDFQKNYNILKVKVEDRATEIDLLTNEIKDLKDMMLKQRSFLKQILLPQEKAKSI